MYISVKLSLETINDLEKNKKIFFKEFNFIALGTQVSYTIQKVLFPYWSRIEWNKYKFHDNNEEATKAKISKKINFQIEALKKLNQLKNKYRVSMTEAISMVLKAAYAYSNGKLEIVNNLECNNCIDKELNMDIQFFDSIADAAFPAVYGVSLSVKDKDDVIWIYIGQSNNPIVRAGEHIIEMLDNPLYFGLTNSQLKNSELILKFHILESLLPKLSLKQKEEHELEWIRKYRPKTQNCSILSASDNMLDEEEKFKNVQCEILKYLNKNS